MADAGIYKFEIGALVELNSGGPVMTVRASDQTTATCQWFSGKKLESGSFALASLKAVKETQEPEA